MFIHQLLRSNINKLINLSEDEFQFFIDCLETKILKKREHLLREGEVCRNAYFVGKGCLRYFHVVQGEEKTGQFFFENSWYTDYESFISGSPSRQNIDALEETEIMILTKINLEKLFVQIPKFERFGRLMAENAFMGLRNRTESLTQMSPEERYLQLIKDRPKLIERIPQHFIASYLNIMPQSLSRIRRRILKSL